MNDKRIDQTNGEPQRFSSSPWRHGLVVATPILVPGSMWALFSSLKGRMSARRAYNAGFTAYWAGWCFGFPLWVLGPRRSVAVLRTGRRPTLGETALLGFVVAGAVGTAFIPHLRRVDVPVATVMLSTAAVNAVGEELLWRGMFLEEFGERVALAAIWPWLGFTAWHLAPQVVLPSSHGRWRFTAAAGLVGAASTATAWRCGGLRATLLGHILTDACAGGAR